MTQTVTLQNQLDISVCVYSTFSQMASTAKPSLCAQDYYPIYTRLTEISAHSTATFETIETLSRLVITQSSNQFPVKLYIPDFMDPMPATTVTVQDQQSCQQVWKFYQFYLSQPYSPLAVQFNEILLTEKNMTLLPSLISNLLNKNGYAGQFSDISLLHYWVQNYLYDFPGVYTCYQPKNNIGGAFILPEQSSGKITVTEENKVLYQANDTQQCTELFYLQGSLLFSKNNDEVNNKLIAILRTLRWEGQPDRTVLCFCGKIQGVYTIVQPYAATSLPWWIIAYDIAYTAFWGIQVVMGLEMALHLLKAVKGGVQYLARNLTTFYQSVTNNLAGQSTTTDSLATLESEASSIEVINTDTDTDTDIDTDVDDVHVEDTDSVVDDDTVTDIDTVVDVDVDIIAVVDVDTDIIVDVDSVSDVDDVDVTNVDTDTDTDVDIDIDTSIPIAVEKNIIPVLLTKVGYWIVETGFPKLVENLVLYFSLQSIDKVLDCWRKQGEAWLNEQAPQSVSGIGLFVNYMLNTQNSVQTRWNSFADFVQQSALTLQFKDDLQGKNEMRVQLTQQMTLLGHVLMVGNRFADDQQKAWRWPQEEEYRLITKMAAYPILPNSQYKAYCEVLAVAQYKGQNLPIKVACAVAIRYLQKALLTG